MRITKGKQTIEQLVASVPNMNDVDSPLGDKVRAVAQRLKELRELLPVLRQRLDKMSTRGGSAQWAFQQDRVCEDGELLADGGDIESLRVETATDGQSTLLRQIHAVERAIEIAQERLRDLRVELQEEQLSQMTDLRETLGREIIGAYQHLAATLERAQNTYSELHSRGFDHLLMTGTPFSLADYDIHNLRGGNGRPSLKAWIENRRTAFKMKDI